MSVLEGFRQRQYDREFESNRDRNLFRGVFDNAAAAQKSAPATLPIGYDNPAAAQMYLDRTRRVYPTDYPVMFWLQKLFAQGRSSIYEIGGHIGVSYYAYRRYLEYPPALRWHVHDVPAVMEQGRRHAAEKDAERRLTFGDDFAQAKDFDIVMAMGSLQYLPDTLAQRLEKLAARPPHVLVNLMPLHEKSTYYTLQSLGTAYCPYKITATSEFLGSFDALGYKLVDTWENPDKKCEIPFHPGHSLDRYFGFHFRLGA